MFYSISISLLFSAPKEDSPAAVHLYPELKWALGQYDESTLQENAEVRAQVLHDICGWEVVSKGYGRSLTDHPVYLAEIEKDTARMMNMSLADFRVWQETRLRTSSGVE